MAGIVVTVVTIFLILIMSVAMIAAMTVILRKKLSVADTEQPSENGVNTKALRTPEKEADLEKAVDITWEVTMNV